MLILRVHVVFSITENLYGLKMFEKMFRSSIV